MSQQSDDELLDELRLVAGRLDPVPPGTVAAARSAIMWRTIDAELAELTADSVRDDHRLVGVRATEVPVMLSFVVARQSLELEVVAVGDFRRVFGQLVPAGPGEVMLRHGGGDTTVQADEAGRFSADAIDPGPVRVRWQASQGPAGTMVETDWFLV